jgi:cytochrome c553
MKKLLWAVVIVSLSALAIAAKPAQQPAGADLSWAYPVADKNPPPAAESGGAKQVPGSTKTYTQAQIDNLFEPPDWFPDEHPAMPPVVQHGSGTAVPACASCHLTSGQGHPESADLAGLSVDYLTDQMADFKSGARKDPARMTAIGMATSDADAQAASQYFASLKPTTWIKVVETDMVPKSYVNAGRMRLPLPGGGMEPLGNRIITLPQDASLATSRDPHSGFIAYVPVGSIAKGQALVEKGGGGKTTPCGICHDSTLQGLDAPRIAGLHPIYVVRQLHNFQSGASSGTAAEMMKPVVQGLDDDDILAIAAYLGTVKP